MNSRNKGKVGEREWAQVLRDNGIRAHRGQQYCGGPGSPDVKTPDLPFHWEVKRVERLNIYDAFAQAMRDCGPNIPIVPHRQNHAPWFVTVADGTDFGAWPAIGFDLKPQKRICLIDMLAWAQAQAMGMTWSISHERIGCAVGRLCTMPKDTFFTVLRESRFMQPNQQTTGDAK